MCVMFGKDISTEEIFLHQSGMGFLLRFVFSYAHFFIDVHPEPVLHEVRTGRTAVVIAGVKDIGQRE